MLNYMGRFDYDSASQTFSTDYKMVGTIRSNAFGTDYRSHRSQVMYAEHNGTEKVFTIFTKFGDVPAGNVGSA